MNFVVETGFCPDCGAILPLPVDPVMLEVHISCCCGYKIKSTNCNNMVVTKAEIVFNEIKEKEKKIKAHRDMIGPTIERTCNKCGHNSMTYKTQQMRSADEGMSIFYYCIKCGGMEKEDS
uniref:DNA-directed RNA polymerase subunit n=1 Tax=Phallusia mammillata TaxID=59560 RepID=A0A6F9DXA5_9ASCI|nr:DNA-directed RNA polymerase I subunit RPA12-like [Phallusia mammillata]